MDSAEARDRDGSQRTPKGRKVPRKLHYRPTEEPPPDTAVREPRRPLPVAGSGAAEGIVEAS